MKYGLQHPSWKKRLQHLFQEKYMQNLRAFLRREYAAGKVIYPRPEYIFHALNITPFEAVKVVILGQDPYHGKGQAHGLSFSVPVGMAVPGSLRNIHKELHDDLGITIPQHGYLGAWAKQGVLLLNSVLTVEHGKAGSHRNKGWERFTDQVIACINNEREHVVFILWGMYAQKKGALIDKKKHFVIQGVHPSPLSASKGFFGQRYFSRANEYLAKHGQEPVDWRLPT